MLRNTRKRKATHRLIDTNDAAFAQKGHITKGKKDLEDLNIDWSQGDHTGKCKIWTKAYEVTHNNNGDDILIGSRCYTDGSKTTNGSGSGLCIMKDEKVIKTRALKLSNNATVFQAELQAIRLGCSIIKECNTLDKTITFMVDSKAALMALENVDTTSDLVRLTKNALNELSNTHEIKLRTSNPAERT